MPNTFPSKGSAKITRNAVSGLDSIEIITLTPPSGGYVALHKIFVALGMEDETDLENLSAFENITITAVGAWTWIIALHPYLEHTSSGGTVFREVNLGPWFFDFGELEGIYGDKDQNMVITVPAFGTGITTSIGYTYS